MNQPEHLQNENLAIKQDRFTSELVTLRDYTRLQENLSGDLLIQENCINSKLYDNYKEILLRNKEPKCIPSWLDGKPLTDCAIILLPKKLPIRASHQELQFMRWRQAYMPKLIKNNLFLLSYFR